MNSFFNHGMMYFWTDVSILFVLGGILYAVYGFIKGFIGGLRGKN